MRNGFVYAEVIEKPIYLVTKLLIIVSRHPSVVRREMYISLFIEQNRSIPAIQIYTHKSFLNVCMYI